MTDYEWLTAMDLCHRCRKEKPAPGRKFCFDCLDKIREENAKRYNPEAAKAYQARRRELYRQKKEQGICVRCSKKATHGMYCHEHSIAVKRKGRQNSEKRRRERHERGLIPDYRRENGLCLSCGKPIEEDNLKRGCLVCREHSKLASENGKKAKENSPWRLAFKPEIRLMQAGKERRNG